VFNAAAQSGLYYLPRLAAAGYGSFRIELVDESPEMVGQLLEGYRCGFCYLKVAASCLVAICCIAGLCATARCPLQMC
jgi:hypothetical protein